MRLARLTLLLLALAAPARAGDIVSPQEFRAFAEGYTLYFEKDGQPFGTESYVKGGRTEWMFRDGTCTPGVWRPHGAQVCFYYGDGDDVQCWRMTHAGEAIEAELLSEGPDQGLRLMITRRDRTPLICAGEGTDS